MRVSVLLTWNLDHADSRPPPVPTLDLIKPIHSLPSFFIKVLISHLFGVKPEFFYKFLLEQCVSASALCLTAVPPQDVRRAQVLIGNCKQD
jgi:hypothetical protein